MSVLSNIEEFIVQTFDSSIDLSIAVNLERFLNSLDLTGHIPIVFIPEGIMI